VIDSSTQATDASNHDSEVSGTELVYDASSGRFLLSTSHGYVAGQQVHINYGGKNNDELLLNYGFVLDTNALDQCSLMDVWSLLPPQEAAALCTMEEARSCIITRDLMHPSLLAFARCLHDHYNTPHKADPAAAAVVDAAALPGVPRAPKSRSHPFDRASLSSLPGDAAAVPGVAWDASDMVGEGGSQVLCQETQGMDSPRVLAVLLEVFLLQPLCLVVSLLQHLFAATSLCSNISLP